MILVTLSSQPIRWGTQQKLPCYASKMRFTYLCPRACLQLWCCSTCPQLSILSIMTHSFPVCQLGWLCWICTKMVSILPPGSFLVSQDWFYSFKFVQIEVWSPPRFCLRSSFVFPLHNTPYSSHEKIYWS